MCRDDVVSLSQNIGAVVFFFWVSDCPDTVFGIETVDDFGEKPTTDEVSAKEVGCLANAFGNTVLDDFGDKPAEVEIGVDEKLFRTIVNSAFELPGGESINENVSVSNDFLKSSSYRFGVGEIAFEFVTRMAFVFVNDRLSQSYDGIPERR